MALAHHPATREDTNMATAKAMRQGTSTEGSKHRQWTTVAAEFDLHGNDEL